MDLRTRLNGAVGPLEDTRIRLHETFAPFRPEESSSKSDWRSRSSRSIATLRESCAWQDSALWSIAVPLISYVMAGSVIGVATTIRSLVNLHVADIRRRPVPRVSIRSCPAVMRGISIGLTRLAPGAAVGRAALHIG